MGSLDVSIIVCGEDFSSTLAHKDLEEFLYLQVPDGSVWWSTGLFALSYLLCAWGVRASSQQLIVEKSPSDTLPFVFLSHKHRYYCFWVIEIMVIILLIYDGYYSVIIKGLFCFNDFLLSLF